MTRCALCFPINLYYFSICCISKDVRSALSHDFAQSNMFEICPVFKKFDNFIFAANEGERMWQNDINFIQNDINFQPSKPNNNRFLRLNFLVVGKGLTDIFDEGKDDSQQYSHKIRSPPWIWTIFWIGFDAWYDFSVLQNQVRLKRDLERENYIRIWSISPSNTIFFFRYRNRIACGYEISAIFITKNCKLDREKKNPEKSRKSSKRAFRQFSSGINQ